MKSMLLILVVFVGIYSVMDAQNITSGAIQGKVKDKQGQVLTGARVVALHVPSGTKYGAIVRKDGNYAIRSVRVGGPYQVTATFVGYKSFTQQVRSVALGENVLVNFVLEEQAVKSDEVVVTANKNAVINSSRTGAAQNISKETIENFPTISRNFGDFVKFTPQISPGNGGSSAGGKNNRYNNVQIDGAQNNDLFGLGANGTPGSQANTTPISLDALQEFQVVLAPYDVRQGRFTGAGINAITRSGTNNWEGSAYYFMRSQSMVGDLNNTIPLNYSIDGNGARTTTLGTFRDSTAKIPFATFDEFQTGVRIGGPIIKDELFFFVNAEITGRNQPYENIAFTQRTNSTDVLNVATQVDSILRNKYGYNPGSYSTTFNTQRPTTKLFARFDWNLNDDHKLTLRHNFIDAGDDIYRPTTTSVLFGSRNYRFLNNQNSTVLQLNSSIGESAYNEVVIGYSRIRDERKPEGSAFPTVIVNDPKITGVSISAGMENFSVANKLSQDVIEFTDNFSFSTGDHSFTVGTQNEFFTFQNLFIRDFYGTFSFDSLQALRNGTASRIQYTFARPGFASDFAPKWSAIQLGLYAQDEWQATEQLRLTLGVRADMPLFPDEPSYNPTADTLKNSAGVALGLQTNKVPSSSLLLSPRVGFNYDVFNDKDLQVRGGVGVFTGRLPYVWISNQYGGTGVELARLDKRASATDTVKFFDGNVDQIKANYQDVTKVSQVTELNITAPDFKMPQVLRLNLALDKKLPFDFVGTIEGIYSQNVNEITYIDKNLGNGSTTTTNSFRNGTTNVIDTFTVAMPGNRMVYGTYSGRTSTPRTQFGSFSRGPFTNIIELGNTNQGYQYSLSAQIQRNVSEGLGGSFAYAYSKAMDINSGLSSQAISQWRFNYVPGSPNDAPLSRSLFEVTHRIIASLQYRIEYADMFATSISLFYEGRSGAPFSYIYDGDINGDGQDGNDLLYVPNSASEILLVNRGTTTKANQTTYDAFFAYINRDEYLSTQKGKITERNGATSTWVNLLDLRLAQEIKLPFGIKNNKIEVTLDCLNFTNLINPEWGRIQTVPNDRDQLLRFEGFVTSANTTTLAAPVGTPLFSYTDKQHPFQYNDLASRWQMQLGVRYSF